MIKSMTGYGRAQETILSRSITVEIKGVNHRFLELSIRMSRHYSFLEEKVRSYISNKLHRGKVDIYIGIYDLSSSDVEVILNKALAESYVNVIKEISSDLQLENNISAGAVAQLPDVLVLRKGEINEEEIWELVRSVLDKAMDSFIEMRAAEGSKLRQDLIMRGDTILSFLSKIEERGPQYLRQYRESLFNKMKELLIDPAISEQRVLAEAAVFADRISVDEEIVRLKSHIAQMNDILNFSGPVGRKLDFLLQEMNREANTIGSKSSDLESTRIVIEIKSELEKMREQIQNIE